MKNYLLFGLTLLVSTMLVSCGFQLRGTSGFELDVDGVSVTAANRYGEFSRELESQLAQQGIDVLAPGQAEFAISILSEHTSRRGVATSSDITASEYELRLTTRFRVVDRSGDILIPETSLFVEKIYRFDRGSLVSSSEEESLLKEEMRRDIAEQLMRRFSAALRKRAAINDVVAAGDESLSGESPEKKAYLEVFEDGSQAQP